jgi:hypothetical protein
MINTVLSNLGFLPFFYHLPVNFLIFTILPVNLKAGKSSTLVGGNIAMSPNKEEGGF